MVNFRKLTEKAKDVVEKRGGTDALKDDAQELRDIAKGKGSLKDKAKQAGKAMKDPGAKGPDHAAGKSAPGRPPEADEPVTRSK
jgi:hypothetical protein